MGLILLCLKCTFIYESNIVFLFLFLALQILHKFKFKFKWLSINSEYAESFLRPAWNCICLGCYLIKRTIVFWGLFPPLFLCPSLKFRYPKTKPIVYHNKLTLNILPSGISTIFESGNTFFALISPSVIRLTIGKAFIIARKEINSFPGKETFIVWTNAYELKELSSY